MKTSRVSAILMLGVFAVNVYIGLFDPVIQQTNITHYYLDWVIAAVDLVAAAILFLKPLSVMWLTLAGIVWPVVYVLGLGVDVYTYLCGGVPASQAASCNSAWPTHTSAFGYLILNEPSQGWKLVQGVMPLAIALLFVVFVLSIISVYRERRLKTMRIRAATGGTPTGPSSPSVRPP